MEFLAGGDLMTLLMRKDILSEEESRFYIAETILAVESVHKLNYIHRDLKPDNVLIDETGHVKLSDFGLCKHAEIRDRREADEEGAGEPRAHRQARAPAGTGAALSATQSKIINARNEQRRKLAYSTVGTPDYIAPEVFGQHGYNETVDWWSVGAILFEMMVGYPPFYSDEPSLTCQKILHWRKTMVIPSEANLSWAATDLLKRLLCDAETRLGKGGVAEIKQHPFFEGVDWNNMLSVKAPWVPVLKSKTDNINFDKFDEEEPFYPPEETKTQKYKPRKVDMNFIGYTYKQDVEQAKQYLEHAISNIEESELSQLREFTEEQPDRSFAPVPQTDASMVQPRSKETSYVNELHKQAMTALTHQVFGAPEEAKRQISTAEGGRRPAP